MHGRSPAATALAAAALLACAVPASARQVRVTAADSGTTVRVRAGDTVRIALPANETTGYRWAITRRPRRTVARITFAAYQPGGGGMPGAGGTQVYRLRAARRGRTRFAARYAQVGSNTVGQRFEIRIRVRGGLS
jgi:predicted secreted protein